MRIILMLFLILMVSQNLWAQRSRSSSARMFSKTGEFKARKIGATMQNFTGPVNKSFSEGSPAYGGEISMDAGGAHLRYFFRGRYNQSVGKQNFIQGTTVFFSGYEFMSFQPEIGVSFYPVSRNERGLNIYLWGAGSASYNYLKLDSIPATVTGVNPKSQEYGWGYGGGIGTEFIMGSSKASGKFLLYAELGFRESTTPLVAQNKFEISGMTFAAGFGF